MTHSNATRLDAEQALAVLADGNRRYAGGHPTYPHQTTGRRAEIVTGQQPFAVIITCSDSRVPPEIIFDCGLGDIFVIRVAGNVLDDVVLGSVEYAAEHLGVGVVMVLGHSRCGAVTAAVQAFGKTSPSSAESPSRTVSHAPGHGGAADHISALTERIRPAVERAAASGKDAVDAVVDAVVDGAITANVELGVAELRASQPVLARLVAEGKLLVVGARYELETGQVRLLSESA